MSETTTQPSGEDVARIRESAQRLGIELDEAAVARTLGVVLKHVSDQERAVKELGLRG
jgi:hypothetical protein